MDPKDRKIKAGTVITEFGITFRVLEDTTAHGCPLIEIIDPGNTNMQVGARHFHTLYQHIGERNE